MILINFVIHHEQIELNRKVLYSFVHFTISAIVNKILIAKNCQILVLNNFLYINISSSINLSTL